MMAGHGHRPIAGIDSLAEAIELSGAASVILDVEPMVVHWSQPESVYAEGIRTVVDALGGIAGVRHIVFASNAWRPWPDGLDSGSARASVTVVPRAGKPWRLSYLDGLPRPMVVVGDQPLTDGLLAWRLQCCLLLWRSDTRVPWWPRWQYRLGLPVLRLLNHAGTMRVRPRPDCSSPDDGVAVRGLCFRCEE